MGKHYSRKRFNPGQKHALNDKLREAEIKRRPFPNFEEYIRQEWGPDFATSGDLQDPVHVIGPYGNEIADKIRKEQNLVKSGKGDRRFTSAARGFLNDTDDNGDTAWDLHQKERIEREKEWYYTDKVHNLQQGSPLLKHQVNQAIQQANKTYNHRSSDTFPRMMKADWNIKYNYDLNGEDYDDKEHYDWRAEGAPTTTGETAVSDLGDIAEHTALGDYLAKKNKKK